MEGGVQPERCKSERESWKLDGKQGMTRPPYLDMDAACEMELVEEV